MTILKPVLAALAIILMMGCSDDDNRKGDGLGGESGTAGDQSDQSGGSESEAGRSSAGGKGGNGVAGEGELGGGGSNEGGSSERGGSAGDAGTDETGGSLPIDGGNTGESGAGPAGGMGKAGIETTGGTAGEAGIPASAGSEQSGGKGEAGVEETGGIGAAGAVASGGYAGEGGAVARGGFAGEAGVETTGGTGEGGAEPSGGSAGEPAAAGRAGEGAPCTGCLVEGTCYADGAVAPNNICQGCDVSRSTDSFSDRDGVSCNDGAFCTVGDACSGGFCQGQSRRACFDNGIFCDGAESCDEDSNACVSSGNPCAASGRSCDEEVECYDPTVPVDEPTCNDDGDVVQHNAVGEELLVDDCISPENHGACQSGVCGCEPGLAGDDCTACLVYVNGANGSGSRDGMSWETAYTTVQAGLAAAVGGLEAKDFETCEVWVAEGTYVPTATDDRTATFQLRANVALYGGFDGMEFARSERNIDTHPTILSGDIGTSGDNGDNVYHVVTGATDGTIDGFTIRDGNANGAEQWTDHGGGMLNQDASPTVTNCTFSGNTAGDGGGMNNWNSSPTVTNCTFAGNAASYFGGGMYNLGSSPTVTNCTFLGNSAQVGGGMLNDPPASPTVTNCTFSGNSAQVGGGMCNFSPSSPTVSNSIFWNNGAGGEIHDDEGSESNVSYSIVKGGYADGTAITDSDPLFVDAEAGDLHLSAGSPAIDAGNGCLASVSATDRDGNSRYDINAVENTGPGAPVDLGAYEFQGGSSDTVVTLPGTGCP